MSLIDATYFRGEINIANISQPAVHENLQFFIDKYEKNLLDKLLGYSMSKAFRDGLTEDPVLQKWIDLRDGVIYQDDSEEKLWEGFVNDEKQSIIANYVYYHYIINEVNQTVGIGNVRPLAENGTIVSPASKLERAWNEMSVWIGSLKCFLKNRSADYPNWNLSNENCNYFRKINQFNL